jgi:isopentenyl-diphosphate Delta-isomerase
MGDEVARRKTEHVRVALEHDIAAPQRAGWHDVHLVHRALPEVDLEAVDTATTLLGKRLGVPLVISSMTGGHPDVASINARLGALAEEFGLAMGVGSQRAAIEQPALAPTYAVAREHAPTALLLANLGAPQLIAQRRRRADGLKEARAAIAMIRADALIIHLNYLQEVAQPEGDGRARGALAALARLAAQVGVPVVAKETGAGLSYEQTRALVAARVAAVDIGGAGGSSMAAMEAVRAAAQGNAPAQALGALLRDWGIPAPVALVEARTAAPALPVIATGGVRSGLDVARALALGATAVAMAQPFLRAASEGEEALRAFLRQVIAELRAAMQLTGAGTIGDLARVPAVILGETRAWLEQRGFGDELRAMAQRGR